MGRPLVGISTALGDDGDYVGFGYPRPLLEAGATPVILPFLEDERDRASMLDRLDALVLAGGRDIEPWRYGRADPHPAQGASTPVLDAIELSYARLAVAAGIPVLGICRGCQVLSVAFGGTLHGDMAEYPQGGADHPGARWDEWAEIVRSTLGDDERPAELPSHPITIAPDSILATHLGERATVNSYHHQAVRDPGEGVRAVAWAPHGVVEAIEMPGAEAFVLGVQWELHEAWQDDPASMSLWTTFVAAARRRADARERAAVSA